MLKIGDFAKIFDVSIKTIRFYEEKGLLHPAYVDCYSGYRYYDDNNIYEMSRILTLKDLGLELSEIKSIDDNMVNKKIMEYQMKIDKINKDIYVLSNLSKRGGLIKMKTFINDEQAIGKWNLINVFKCREDYPNNVLDFDLPIKNLFLMPKGLEYWVISWSKNVIYIKDRENPYVIEGNKMFVNIVDPIDSNEYVVAVYEKENDKEYNPDEIKIKDNININFTIDEEVLGTWKSVSYIGNTNDDIVDVPKEELYLEKLIFNSDGDLFIKYNNGNTKISKYSKGKIINLCCKDTCSNYIFKEVNGKKYLIAEWKSGDYIYGNMINCYYVLEKID